MLALKKQWEVLASWYFNDPKQIGKQYKKLKKHYKESHRHYHNLAHIEAMLVKAESVSIHWKEADLVYFAIWFHDVIYDATRTDNEEQSAALAVQVLTKHSKLDEDQIQFIEQLILSTAKHVPLQDNKDFHLFLDIDLSILGEPWTMYKAYAKHIRQEYKHVPKQQYRVGRKQILKRFLERKDIYYSSLFHDLYEKQARDNIQREINKKLS